MKKLIAVTALTTLMCAPAFAQNTAPQAQTDTMQKPGTMEKGSPNSGMGKGTTGMSNDSMANDSAKGNPKKEMSKDGSPAAGSKDMKK
jgi:hypothetical protein